MDKREYSEIYKKASKNSNCGINTVKAFLIGGAICTLGQYLIDLYSSFVSDNTTALTLTSITLILISAILTGFGIYDKIAKHAGAGTLVPITGFANSVVAPAIEFKTEGLILGLGAKIFIISGPVILYGILASTVYGIFYYFFPFFF